MQPKQWVFLHIPKSAGVSVQKLLDRWNTHLGEQRFLAPRQHFFFDYNASSGRNGKFDYGGISQFYKEHHLEDRLVFCTLRDPYEWYLSLYLWSHGVDPRAFQRKGLFRRKNLIPHFESFEEFILSNKVTYVGAARPHLNICNSYIRVAHLVDDISWLLRVAAPDIADRLLTSGLVLTKENRTANVPNEQRRERFERSGLRGSFAQFVENREVAPYYTNEMRAAIESRDRLIFTLIKQPNPLINLGNKLGGELELLAR